MTEVLGAIVREKWTSLLADGFDIVEEDPHLLLLKSSIVTVRVVLDPRGEVDIDVFRTGGERLYGWAYTGIVGRASVGRLLEIALAQMRQEPAILRGDAEFYEALANEKRARAHAMTEYHAGRGPRPGRRLP
ncbi:hypothetical protein M6D93_06420 [Jatrophihabitans telluris]|uniref:Uncharacterized protein n=1 Tax=Jatrophihabitans telluris TaxID=2038343 RepID=A0ABY4R3Q8_9ACTN|nr:hypothetical protein [Jatrophihabitans telluris]UQX89634.1 hypothetical protein M6D93_06420 [Jatrophihabitans telluris]